VLRVSISNVVSFPTQLDVVASRRVVFTVKIVTLILMCVEQKLVKRFL
jgi:hypothetical protein